MGCQNWLHLCPSNILILYDGLGGVIRFIPFVLRKKFQAKKDNCYGIFQFSFKDHKYDSMKICSHKMPKHDVRYKAYVGVITAFFAYLISKSIRNIHCNRPIVPNNSPLVGMGNPPAGCIVTN